MLGLSKIRRWRAQMRQPLSEDKQEKGVGYILNPKAKKKNQ